MQGHSSCMQHTDADAYYSVELLLQRMRLQHFCLFALSRNQRYPRPPTHASGRGALESP